MNIAQIIVDLQAYHAGLDSVKSAPATRPVSVPSANCPCILLRPGSTEIRAFARAISETTIRVEGICLIGGPLEGIAVSGVIDLGETVRSELVTLYEDLISNAALGELPTSMARVISYADSGEASALIEYENQRYLGFTFTVSLWS
jgi:hypothetical protein